jgi:opacity protein-like surface antigen
MRLIRPLLIIALIVTALLVVASPAYADFTFFGGWNQTPTNRALKGFALGGGKMIAFEFEYANNGQDIEEGTPGLRTFLGNVLVQPPFAVAGFQPYATAGTGMYRETLDTHQESAWSFNTGVGVKTSVFGPLKVRVDYRVLKLRGNPLYSTVNRVYTGVHLVF